MSRHTASPLIAAVTVVLIILLLREGLSLPVVLSVTIVLVVLIMVGGNASQLLPEVLSALRDIFRPK